MNRTQDPSLRGSTGRPPGVAIIGAGMSGMLMGIRLKQAGLEDFAIYEKGHDVGGTWRENSYPGLACDVPAHYYTYSFEPNPAWEYRFARGPEIQRYMCSIADRYDLRRHIRFGQELVHGRHDGERWQLSTREGKVDEVEVLIAATGVLHHPRYPELDGLDRFAGACFHSARWDHSVGLVGKRIGLIGTGASGVQIVTSLGLDGHDLTVFQRTPQWLFPMPDRAYGALDRWLARVTPGLAKALYRGYQLGFEGLFANAVVDRTSVQYRVMDSLVRLNLMRVRDPELRRKLTPDYAPMCKRMIMSLGFYEAVQRKNVKLVTGRIARVVPEGVVTEDGTLHPLDVLVLATGFNAHEYLRPVELETAEGKRLSQVWAERPKAYRTVGVPGFPNFFLIMGPRSPIGNYSLISVAETQTEYVLRCLQHLRGGRFSKMSPREEITEALDQSLDGEYRDTAWASGCASWYLDPKGIPSSWPRLPADFRASLRKPKLEEFDLR